MELEQFPVDEIDFISDQQIIITKNRLTKKIIKHLEVLRSYLVDYVKKNPFPGIYFPSGKISKGENYLGFPYLVLDYPAILKKDEMFAIRTVIWWGNHISNVFIVKGKYLQHFKRAFVDKTCELTSEKLFYRGESPWLNEINKKYISCDQLTHDHVKNQIDNHGFVKVAEIYGFNEINNLKAKTEGFIDGVRAVLYD